MSYNCSEHDLRDAREFLPENFPTHLYRDGDSRNASGSLLRSSYLATDVNSALDFSPCHTAKPKSEQELIVYAFSYNKELFLPAKTNPLCWYVPNPQQLPLPQPVEVITPPGSYDFFSNLARVFDAFSEDKWKKSQDIVRSIFGFSEYSIVHFNYILQCQYTSISEVFNYIIERHQTLLYEITFDGNPAKQKELFDIVYNMYYGLFAQKVLTHRRVHHLAPGDFIYHSGDTHVNKLIEEKANLED